MDPIAEQLIARLQSDPHDSAAYEALKAHYHHSGDLASLANLLEGWAGHNTHDPRSASQAYAEAADAVLHSTADHERAKRLYRLALQFDVHFEQASERLQALLEGAQEFQELAEFLDAYTRTLEESGGQPARVAALHQRLGELWEQHFARADVAAAYYERAAELAGGADPSTLQPPAADPQALVAHYEAAIAAEHDPGQKAALLSQLATLRHEQLGDLAGAIVALRAALAALPGEVAIMHQLATCLLARAATAEPRAARADQRRVAELLYQIAQAVEASEAIAYLESALAAMPDHDGALAMLERLAPQCDRSDVLPQYWVAYVASAGEGPDLDQRRLMLGQAYLRAGQLDDAAFCLQPAAEHGNDRAHELLQDVYGRKARAVQHPPDAPTEPEALLDERNMLPTTRPKERRNEREDARESAQVVALRKQVHEALAARRHDEAAEHCRAILELEPNDPESFTLLESHFRKRRDYPGLRDLLLGSTRVPGLSVDTRKLRLREVATLSETKLKDPEAAISAFRGVVTLDPFDREASANLKRLLKKAQQWDELAAVLEREALATTVVDEKAALIREIALIHRDRRKDPQETAEAFRQLYALKPEDAAVRDELCELLLTLEYWGDAVPLLRERIATSSDEIDRLKLSTTLATVLHENLNHYDEAFDACEKLLELRPNDRATFDRMERIDEASENHARLLSTLERRARLAGKAERPALFVRMGNIAEQQLHDLDKAAEYLGEALDLAPENQDALERLSQMFENAGRYTELVELLRERTVLEKEAKNRAPLYRRIAQILAERLNDEDGAAETYRSLLDLTEDEAALRFLRQSALRKDEHEELSHILRRLAALVQDNHERRDLLFDQAVLLHERLSRSAEATVALKRIVEEIDPQFEPAIELLVTTAEATSDNAALALALDHRLALLAAPEARIPLAKRLADLCEQELRDGARAIAALQRWAKDDVQNPEPHRRLRKLLEATDRVQELLATLDALAEWELEFDARDEAAIAAARVAHARAGDHEGAFGRLLPLVEQRNEVAEQALREVALGAGMQRQLAAVYVKLAQETEDPAAQALYWKSAADVYERELSDPAQAFEASLRMLATDLSNRDFLSQVDRLGRATSAFKRLAQVYDRLLKQAEDDGDKVALLTRHADLLEAEQPDEALDRVLRACGLAPQDEQLLVRAEELALRTRRSEELLVVYDRKRAKSDDDAAKVSLLLRAARLCDGALRDRERANLYLKGALTVAAESAALGSEVEAVARELDAARPELGADQARRTLITAHREVAERAEPAAATRLLLRAAELLTSELDDERGAFEVLRHAVGKLPKNDDVYAALLGTATKLKRLDAVDAHLTRLVDEAIDPNTAVALLRRRGELLEGALDRAQDAAAVYTKLLQLRPDDADAAEKLRTSLRRSGRYQDLLLALNKQLQRTREPAARVAMLKEIALSWEQDLKNRWEAVDAWKAVVREAPGDPDATSALARLERGRASTPPPADDDDDEAPRAQAVLEARIQPADPAAEADGGDDDEDTAEHDEDTAEHDEESDASTGRPAAAAQAAFPEEHTLETPAPPPAPERVALRANGESNAPQGSAGANADPWARGEAALHAAPAADAFSVGPTLPIDAHAPAEGSSDDSDAVDDLAALDAGLSAAADSREVVDVLEDLDSAAMDVDVEAPVPTQPRPPAPAPAQRPSRPPPPPPLPLPQRTSQPGSVPPPPPSPARASSPPLPGASRSKPPPLPSQRKPN